MSYETTSRFTMDNVVLILKISVFSYIVIKISDVNQQCLDRRILWDENIF